MSGTCGIEEDCSAPDLAPKGRNNEAQAEGLDLDYPQILPPALKGRNRSSPIPALPTTTGTCGIERNVPPLQGSGIGLGPADPGLQPGVRYFAPLGLTCPHPLPCGEGKPITRAGA